MAATEPPVAATAHRANDHSHANAPASIALHEPRWPASAATRVHRTVRDTWDVVRWARHPLEFVRALLPVPTRWMGLQVLNDCARSGDGVSPEALSRALASLRNMLESEAFVDGRVDYRRLATSPAYAELQLRSRTLVEVTPESFSCDAERVAFWLNAYNVLSVHGVVALRLRRSALELPSFFSRVAYRVGEHVFSLDDISNGVLRVVARRPASGRPQFRSGDPRIAYCPRAVDPRIHGALVCVAASCPPVGCYVADCLDAQLDLAAQNLVSQCVSVDHERRRIRLPLQFYYYAADFRAQGGVAAFILRHLRDPQRQEVRAAIEAQWRVAWDPYDWSLNAPADRVASV